MIWQFHPPTGDKGQLGNFNSSNYTDACQSPGPSRLSWARVVTSSPYVTHNPFSALQSGGSDNYPSQSEDDRPFTEVTSRRPRRVRRRQDSKDANPPQKPGARLLVGTSRQAVGSITAAKCFESRIPRAVLYVDNLSNECSVDHLTSFVKNLSVNVFTCFEVVSRHRYGTEPDTTRSAFRLCIAKTDLAEVINQNAWPDSVVISEWIHKKPSESTKRTHTNVNDPPVVESADQNNTASPAGDSLNAAVNSPTDMDTTVIYSGAPLVSITHRDTPASSAAAAAATDDNTVPVNNNNHHGDK